MINSNSFPHLKLIDTHCHLDMEVYGENLPSVVDSAKKKGVTHIITIGIDAKSSKKCAKLSRDYPMISATVGIHPHGANKIKESDYDLLVSLKNNPANKIVGYGEIGLDYVKNYAPKNIQNLHFESQLELARHLQLPVIIHDREAHGDTMRLLRSAAPFTHGGVMHCFSGNIKLAHQVLDLGLHISIPGIVTFINAPDLQRVAKEIPLDRLLLETDGPFLAPVPFRGKVNLPEYLVYTAKKVAEIRHLDLETIAYQTSANANDLFQLGL